MYSGDFKRRRNGNNQNKNRQFENRRDNRHQPFNNRIPGAEGAFPPKVPPIDRKKVIKMFISFFEFIYLILLASSLAPEQPLNHQYIACAGLSFSVERLPPPKRSPSNRGVCWSGQSTRRQDSFLHMARCHPERALWSCQGSIWTRTQPCSTYLIRFYLSRPKWAECVAPSGVCALISSWQWRWRRPPRLEIPNWRLPLSVRVLVNKI